ncbi:MAG: 30S ribosomal protein S4, partial [Candidatus Pacearchaeota archaeon]|nr:30S ribosomal protein S4 [Candidatus Pacearchaeota archaeon]
MGDPRKKHKKYSRPRQLFSKERIEEEKVLVKKYGLKNRREIWRAESYINRLRAQAKKLILQPEQQESFINRLAKLGLVKS